MCLPYTIRVVRRIAQSKPTVFIFNFAPAPGGRCINTSRAILINPRSRWEYAAQGARRDHLLLNPSPSGRLASLHSRGRVFGKMSSFWDFFKLKSAKGNTRENDEDIELT